MKLLREVNAEAEGEIETSSGSDVDQKVDTTPGPFTPDGWSVGHLANHGILLACDGFSIKLDVDQLNKLFDIAEDGVAGEIRDHDGKIVLVEPTNDGFILTRANDLVYPSGVMVDLDALKELGIEAEDDDETEETDGADGPGHDQDPGSEEDSGGSGDSVDPEAGEEGQEDPEEGSSKSKSRDKIKEIEEGVKMAYRRVGKKIKRGFRVTSGFRKGRVVSSVAGASKPRAKASTRLKLKLAARKKKIVRILKSKRTRKKSLSKRLVRMNKLRR